MDKVSPNRIAPAGNDPDGRFAFQGVGMGRLSAAKPRLGAMPTRLRGAPKTESERLRHRDETQPWRSWYKTARWQKLRQKVLDRDGYVCQATGAALVGAYPAENSPVVDHIRPHRGDASLFWDESNLQSVSKRYHDSEKQRQEQRFGGAVPAPKARVK